MEERRGDTGRDTGRYGEIAGRLSCVALKPSDMSQRHFPQPSRNCPARYPDATLEPLQCVRYVPGQYYKPHHDFYNACETWLQGNRHFTFLVYLRAVPGGGGETLFPRLNITVDATPYAALLFNNCLDNGEPDERTQHEGVAPLKSIKYAINGWVRAKHISRGGM